MPSKEPRAALSDKQARGGVIGGKGYDFQAAYIASRIPLWLDDPGFVQFLPEGAGDVDVRFKRNGGEERWYVQVKNYAVKPSKAREVFDQFHEIDAGTPGTYTRFTLACPGLHDNVKRLRVAVEDLRGVADFYQRGKDAIIDNTWRDLDRLVEAFKLKADADFLVGKVHFDTNLAGLTDDTDLCDLFVARLQKTGAWGSITRPAAVCVYEKLKSIPNELRRVCSREQIEAIIREAIAQAPVETADVEIIPSPPAPYYGYRYPMPENWTGRRDEMDTLDAWLAEDEKPMCCLIAIGGMGKSSLAWAWLRQRVVAQQEPLGLRGIFQCSFYEGEIGFRRFLEDLCAYLGVSSEGDPVTVLTQRLAEERVLLVLDGFERLLCAYASVDAALLPERPAEELEPGERRCADLATSRFLRALVADPACKTLLTSRLVPQELDRLDGWQKMELPGLAPDEAVAYLRACGIKGTRRELQDAAAVYNYHPLSLSKLVEVLHYDLHQPDDVRQAPRYDVAADLKARHNHILERAYETLPEDLAQFLSELAALRGKATMDVVRFLAGNWTEAQISANLRRLEENRWVTWERAQGMLEFHPVVRRYAYGRLGDKPGTHARLAEHFRPLAEAVDTKRVKSVDDLTPVIELYHHTVRAGQYDEACDLLYNRLVPNPLYYCFGAHQLIIELLSALFPSEEPFTPSGEAVKPLLSTKQDQSWTANALANSYSLSGQSARAMLLFELCVRLDESKDSKRNAAVDLTNLALDQVRIGALASVNKNLRRSIALFREIQSEVDEAISHREQGRLLVHTGAFKEAGQELEIALRAFEKQADPQGVGITWLYHALRALLMGNATAALEAAHRAHEIACSRQNEQDRIRAEWLLGAALRARGELAQAEEHLNEALRRCCRINLVESEPDILLELARLRRDQAGEVGAHRDAPLRDESLSLAREALEIADRCEYRLKQADCHNFLAQLALETGNLEEAHGHAETARECAWCDGPGHRYEVAYQEAERLLGEIESRT